MCRRRRVVELSFKPLTADEIQWYEVWLWSSGSSGLLGAHRRVLRRTDLERTFVCARSTLVVSGRLFWSNTRMTARGESASIAH